MLQDKAVGCVIPFEKVSQQCKLLLQHNTMEGRVQRVFDGAVVYEARLVGAVV